jgi:two-component system, chemotaxis family, protein-glutamate methylesterase/glutaminase
VTLRVLIGDDSIVFRALLKKILSSIEGVEVCDTASDGRAVLNAIERSDPDVVILDVEMPILDGIGVMKSLNLRASMPDVIMCSSFTTAGAEVTIQALELGAHDFISKPDCSSRQESELQLKNQLLPQLLALKSRKISRESTRELRLSRNVCSPLVSSRSTKPELIAIGISTGGPSALSKLLPEFPRNFPVPIVIVQHMPPLFLESLSNSLAQKIQMNIKVAENGEVLKAGVVYLAPGQQHLGIQRQGLSLKTFLSDGPPENFCKPAADFLFRSVADCCGKAAIGVVMTGMGHDGAAGLKLMHDSGALTIAQDRETCTIFGMPKEAIAAGAVDVVLPLEEISQKLKSLLNSF